MLLSPCLRPQGLTALHLAIAKRKTEVVTELVEAGTDLKRKLHGSNSSYLHLAAINGLEVLPPIQLNVILSHPCLHHKVYCPSPALVFVPLRVAAASKRQNFALQGEFYLRN